ncbi:hypothetical protein [Methylobacterium sp. WCS2018Hpa-22]|uniref:hypothetical protein n=1 Tax=Methylobacterium sp. WCS2018Hpa-22 TaxID=3073633 RepID=UPI0028893D57|nr:hypothetical protein [Methylobacterium sp. WCS2018Hpa-22]
MAHWNISARVVDQGVVVLDSPFLSYEGVKIITSEGERKFLGTVIMHKEVSSLFSETYGEHVELYFAGKRNKYPAVLYGIKSQGESVYNKHSPRFGMKVLSVMFIIFTIPTFFGLVAVPLFIWCYLSMRSWDPPRRKVFDAHVPGTDGSASGSPTKGLAGRQAA